MKKTYHFEIEINVKPSILESEDMPDCAGLWVDREGDIWMVNNDLAADVIRLDGNWMPFVSMECWMTPDKYAEYAPFTRVIDVTTSKEDA